MEYPDENPHLSKYYEFESMFQDDITQALSIQQQQIGVKFMKEMGRDLTVVLFHLIYESIVDEQFDGQEAYWIVDKISDLSLQVSDKILHLALDFEKSSILSEAFSIIFRFLSTRFITLFNIILRINNLFYSRCKTNYCKL